ncbi:MAG TPA: HAD family phosphatase [Terriglobia bacterium]|nr:HAD family phosphatase [Terriglobia bacterium]
MTRIAFYDFDGTLASGNVVQRYAFFARHQPSRLRAAVRYARLLLNVPLFFALDFFSRRLFNQVFFMEYRGLRERWLRGLDGAVFDEVIRPKLYPQAKALVESDRGQGFVAVLVTGELDFIVGPVVQYFGFDAVISNSMVFREGRATGMVAPPLIAGGEKVEAMKRFCAERDAPLAGCRAYSDSFSDRPMLESVGNPVAVNPDRRLKRVAAERGWPVLDLRSAGFQPGMARAQERPGGDKG